MTETLGAGHSMGEGPARLVSLDGYRGFVMLAMASGGLALGKAAAQHPASPFWGFLAYQTDHAPWIGCSFWDLIQPSFMFIVGVAMPYSYAKRVAAGDSPGRMLAHVLYRSLVLVLLGIFLSSNWSERTDFTFVNVLTQIGLGYTFVFLLLGKGWKTQLAAAGAILAGYWLAFFLHSTPALAAGASPAAGAAAEGQLTGLFSHWSKNANFASDFDVWFLNLFPRKEPFHENGGGYQTLNFVPSMATMLFGVAAGELLRGPRELKAKVRIVLLSGAGCLLGGFLLGETVCPIVKRIWTPSWAIFSTGWTCLLLGVFVWAIDLRGHRRWAFALVVVGMNSIAMYVMAQLLKPWVSNTLKIHLGRTIFSGPWGPVVESASVLMVFWLVCLWLYRRKVFIRI
jgi:heparan-alpha-glucosaminide N-acetyltransferase